jgi:hypothetical protein
MHLFIYLDQMGLVFVQCSRDIGPAGSVFVYLNHYLSVSLREFRQALYKFRGPVSARSGHVAYVGIVGRFGSFRAEPRCFATIIWGIYCDFPRSFATLVSAS